MSVKILQAAQFFPPDIGGEERHVLNLSLALAQRGHEVAVVTQLLADTMPDETIEHGVRVTRIKSSMMRLPRYYSDVTRPYHLPVPDPALRGALRAMIAQYRPDIVHAHNWIVNSVLAVPHHFGLVLTLHDYSHVCATKRLMLNGSPCSGPSMVRCLRHAAEHYGPAGLAITVGNALMHPWKDRGIDHVVAVSMAVAEGNRLPTSGVQWSVVPNFIPDQMVERPDAFPNDSAALPDGKFILFVGDLSEEKGIKTLFRAYNQLPLGTPPLICVGRRTPETPMELPRGVTVFEKWPHDRVMAAFRRCTVAVLPSTWPDPCPTTVLEAMAMGRPVVTTSIGGVLDMVDPEVSGVCVAPADHGQLAQALQRLLADSQLQASLGQAARRKVHSFTATHVATRLESIYREVLRKIGRKLD